MKLVFLLLTVACLQLRAESYAQQVTLHKKNISLGKVFEQIYDQTGYQFVCTKDMLKGAKKINISVKNAPLDEVLNISFKGQPLSYVIRDKAIIVRKKGQESEDAKEIRAIQPIEVTGKVTDSLGNPLIGVTVKAKAGGTGTVTDANGNYAITVPDDAVLVVSYVGYQTQEELVNGKEEIDIVLKSSVSELDQLVVVGYGTQKKSDLTGSVASIGSDEFNKGITTNAMQLIEGKASGVNISQANAEPGGGL